MKKYFKIILLAFSFFIFSFSWAGVSPLAVSLVPPLEFPPADFTVTGARLSVLWGHQRNFYGVDLGLGGNITDLEYKGLAISGLFNNTRGTTTILGLQLAGIANINESKTHVYGLQVALGANYNESESTVSGLQIALLTNLSAFTDIYGAQIGLYNRAKDVYGLQIGLVNVAESLHGIQIGLLNFNHKGTFVVSPILNAGF